MASSSKINLRDSCKIFLVGRISNQIIGSKLPSIKQVLSVLFFNMRKVNLNLHDSAKLVIREVVIFWEKARIPVREEYHLLKKVESLYNEWRNLQKHSTRKSARDRKNEEDFVNKFDDIFDIAHARALNLMKIESDKQFLIAQRTKGRPGCMLGIDRKNQQLEECNDKKLKNMLERKKRVYEDMEISGIYLVYLRLMILIFKM